MSNWMELLERAKATDPQPFAVYLQGLRSQWSLDERDEASTWVLQALRARQAPMNLSAAAALYQAFGWDDAGCGLAPGELRELAEHAWQDWLQLPAQTDVLAQQMEARGGRWTSPDDAASRLKQLRKPHSHLRNLMTALPLRVPRQAAALMDVLGCHEDRPMPPGIDPGQARFWAGASDVTRLIAAQLSLLRALLASVALTLVAFIALATTQIASMLLPYQSEEQRRAIVLGTAALAPVLGTLLAIGLRHLFVWQSAPEEPSLPPSGLRWLTLPVACAAIAAAGTAVYLWVPSPSLWLAPLCWLLAWTVLTTAWIRYQLRRGKPVRMALPVSFLVMLSVLSVLPALLGALLLWSMDLFGHRQRLRRS
ncbi:hypothetical protein [Stenotrophomonas indicatrix]|uniref:hypothetical protein n=1 Tax=Stenotrophomonas indicatrix TaxID=2045451 RepID=UPI0032084770